MERITTLEKQMFDLNEENDKIRGDLLELKCTNAKLEEQNTSLQSQVDNLQSEVELRSMVLEDLQQYSRRNCILVTGVPEEPSENTDKLIKEKELSTEKMEVPLNDKDIDRSHRVGKPKAGKARAIIVKLTRKQQKDSNHESKEETKGN